MKIISNYLEEEGIGKRREADTEADDDEEDEERFRSGEGRTKMASACWAPFCNGSQERSRVALEHVDEGTRIGEGQNTRTRLTPSPLFKHSVLGTFDYYLFFCQNHQDRNL